MKRFFFSLLIGTLFVLPTTIPALSQASQLQAILENISVTSSSETQEQVSFQLNRTNIPKAFALNGKQPKVVFDFPDTGVSDNVKPVLTTNGKLIKRIRVGLHEPPNPKTRVVFDLVSNEKINFKQQFDETSNTLIITVFRSDVPAQIVTKKQSYPKNTTKAETATEKTSIIEKQAIWEKELNDKEKKVESDLPQKITTMTTEAVAPVAKAVKVAKKPFNKITGTVAGPLKKAVTPLSIAKQEEQEVPTGDDNKEIPAVSSPKVTNLSEIQPARPGSGTPTLTDDPTNATVQQGKTPVLYSIEFDNTSNRGEMILFQLNDFYPPIVFGLEEDSPRVVCDFMNTESDKGVKALITTKGQYVQGIRTASHENPNKIRTVIDLLPNNNYDLQQVFFKEENLFILIVNKINDAK